MIDHPVQEPNGWFETYVQHRFDQLAAQVVEIDRKVEAVRQTIPADLDKKLDAVRQTVPRIDERTRITAVLFGLIGGFLPAAAALVYFAFRGMKP